MRIIRGAIGFTGAAMAFMATWASEWEPLPILMLGLSGMALCCIAKAMPVRPRAKKKAACQNVKKETMG